MLSALTSGEVAWDLSSDPPPALAKSLADADRALEFIGHCSEVAPKLSIEGEYQRIRSRYWTALRLAEGVWLQAGAGTESDELPSAPLACRERNIRKAARDAEAALGTGEKVFSEATAAMQSGIWVGPLRLCRETVVSAEVGLDSLLGQPKSTSPCNQRLHLFSLR
jgi:hypothetical protein